MKQSTAKMKLSLLIFVVSSIAFKNFAFASTSTRANPTTASTSRSTSASSAASTPAAVCPLTDSSSKRQSPAVNSHYANETEAAEYTPFDGWYNNYAHPEWGAAETALLRLLPPAYGDGVYAPSGANRPNPLSIARAVFDGPTGSGSYKNRTAFLVFFGQQLVEEILDAQGSGCPPEYFNIPIPKGHPLFDPHGEGGRELPLLRTRYDTRTGYSPNVPREQLNEVSSFFDGSLMYGPNKAWSDVLRLFKGGRMKSLQDADPTAKNFPAVNIKRLPYANPPPPRDHYLKPVKRFYTIGNPRGNENPFLLTMGIMWFRYHNYIARRFEREHPDWSDERLFNEARQHVIAVHQKIVYHDWLLAWLGEKLPAYNNSYDPQVHPQIAHVFQSAAMRFGHTLVPPGVFRRNATCHFRNTTVATHFSGRPALRTCNTFWNPQEAINETDIDELIMGMASQIAEREDNIVTPDLHGDVFGPLEFSRRDLMAVNIQRGRDHGLPDYNTAREFFGLPRITCWRDINPELYAQKPDVFENFSRLYNYSLDDVDIWPAGMLETTPNGPGLLFRTIIKNQFTRIRNGDRFWFENYKQNKLFTEAEFQEIMNTTILDVILAVTNITKDHIQANPFFHVYGDVCPQPFQLKAEDMENCTEVKSYDYFYGSEVSYALTLLFILGSIVPIIGILLCLAHYHKKTVEHETAMLQKGKKRQTMVMDDQSTVITAIEWMGESEGQRIISVWLDSARKRIVVKETGKIVRIMELSRLTQTQRISVFLAVDSAMTMMMVRIPGDYDLVLDFEEGSERQNCLQSFMKFFRDTGVSFDGNPSSMSKGQMKATAVTKVIRQRTLETFFKAILSNAFKYDSRRASFVPSEGSEVLDCELTKYEFAEALSMQPDALFVENMFRWVDKNANGAISFREFLDFFVIFSKGSADDKAKLLFDIHDVNNTGRLSKAGFKMMLRSMVELANESIEEDKIVFLVDSLFQKAGLEAKNDISFDDFMRLLSNYRDELDLAGLNIRVGEVNINAKRKRDNATTRARKTIYNTYKDDQSTERSRFSTIQELRTIERSAPVGTWEKFSTAFSNFMSNNRLQIFWATIYTLVVFGIFIERVYYYATEREQTGLRRICGYGVSITRGAANVEMFSFSVILLTMCRNIITFLRDTVLHRYVPFDNAVDMHKLVAFWGTFFTLVHIIGHCFNFYHISTQTANDLACIFRNFFHPTDFLPKFQKWCWTTITGLTGVALTIQYFVLAVFSTQYARRHCYRGFWLVHSTYPIFYILMIMHGCGRLVQPPFFYYFFLGPVIVFTIDKLISISRRKIEIVVVKAEHLPSDVLFLQVKRPTNFHYKSGQWLRIACLEHNKSEYHPLTLTSAPHEEYLSLHIRAIGPWTIQMFRLYDPRLIQGNAFPKIYLDGPYGESHQDWRRHEVAILIGAGIGITPYASILKDIAHMMGSGGRMSCKKIYFVWVTRTQRHFEWMTDIIRELENKDTRGLVSSHIFITEFKEKFDIRTTMLYICERYFQKISNRSLFTGLQSVTHFGRPDFEQFFKLITAQHPETSVFGVFSCGPPSLTHGVEKACAKLNTYTKDVIFEHRSENI